ncbi:flagellar biosynthesis protein FliQ [Peribacillus castrilensis]|jgi:flagellar biosynthesis protein FliQ|uniref:Flagellar biosynthetic protein FliQ n=2 Tax=Peribacillus TaxID=2675229 RepID=A0AAJ1QLE7_9BACI|nr:MULTISPECIES: flagellar biosynthesis protein FliQ [Bacillaceae]MBL3641936.1 flagellar biosynthesis protein FliQ [Bacillus sp. RHFB]MBT2603339.1 flagellar biosynthesis protein FliQ [Bacillus sp. ISL-53]MCD1160402.1 flagellar biosynthesis protein FliQ [Peribacillus castrilensis]MCP1093061.1 flagellar biosynthesis protein FliQ [Bacillaceae bacterium OS4b]QYF81483.1 flagellar biosynthesis protein FliQ [Brevibacterium sp. PAMC21349]TDL89625.1 flagellar biosynthesis protein FliQ [Vibrio vulnific
MSADFVIDIAEKGIYMVLIIAGPLMVIALIVGLVVSIFQATTQIQEQTLAFVPKIVAVLLGLILLAPWMLSHLLSYANEIFGNLNRFVG